MTDAHADDLTYYAEPGRFTRLDSISPGSLPDSIPELVSTVQGLLVHRAWLPAYGIAVSPARSHEEGLHSAEAMLARVMMLHEAPLTVGRDPADRMLANCRHFATLLTAFLRRRGVPARGRCGFATYFEPGKFVDHWVCEYWHEDQGRWRMVDAQLDAVQRGIIKPDFDPFDVPESRFWVSGKAWGSCRTGNTDSELFGIADMWGLWYVQGNLCLDIASLNKIELLPWEASLIARQLGQAGDLPPVLDRMAILSSEASYRSPAGVRNFFAMTPEVRVTEEALREIEQADASGTTASNPLADRPGS